MKHIKLLLAATAIASLSLFTACKSTSGGSGGGSAYGSSSSSSSSRTIADPNFFRSFDNAAKKNIYLVGTPEAAAAYEASGEVPNANTFPGQIPGGFNLVVQADSATLQNRLIAEFTRQTGIVIK